MEANGDESPDRDVMWMEFRKKVEASLEKHSAPVDMGMDRGL